MQQKTFSTWTPRRVHLMTLPSGAQRKVRRPGPELALRAARLQRTLKINLADIKGKSEEEIADSFLGDLDDAKEVAALDLAVKIFLACMVNDTDEEYRVVERPQRPNEISPADIPAEDFWAVVRWCNQGCPDIPVQLVEGETDISAVEMFPTERAGSNQPYGNGETVWWVTEPTARVM